MSKAVLFSFRSVPFTSAQLRHVLAAALQCQQVQQGYTADGVPAPSLSLGPACCAPVTHGFVMRFCGCMTCAVTCAVWR